MSWITFQGKQRGAVTAIDKAFTLIFPQYKKTKPKLTFNMN